MTTRQLALLLLFLAFAVVAFRRQAAAPTWEHYVLRTQDKRWQERLDSLGEAGWQVAAYGPLLVSTDRLDFGAAGKDFYGVLFLKRQRTGS